MSSAIAKALSRKTWEEHEPIPDQDKIDAARDRMHSATSLLKSAVASEVSAIVNVIPTSAVDTLAVTLLPDGFVAQVYNPDFVLSLETDTDLAFIRTHEIYHLLMRHLWGDRDMKGDDVYVLAQEATINERVQRLMMGGAALPPSKRMMPRALNPENGEYEETGVNPFKTWERYRKDLKEQGLDPASFADFYSSDIRCYSELKRMNKNPHGRNKAPQCETGSAISGQNSAGGGGGDQPDSGQNQDQNQNQGQGQQPTVDPGMLKEVVEGGLEQVVRQAQERERAGHSTNQAKDELSDLMDMPDQDESISTMWGDIGANQLRGKATETRKVEFWKQYLQSSLHTRLVPGERLVYNQAIWWEPRLSRKGEEETQKVLVPVDTSGSMHTGVINYIAELIGDEDDIELHFVAFDTQVYPIEIGEPLRGGGGTSIVDIERYIAEEMNNDVDAVVCVTDGYFNPEPPQDDPDKWVFLITPGGDGTWMDDAGLTVYDLDINEEDL